MVRGCELKTKDADGRIRKGLCKIHYDITTPKDTNPRYQREITGLTGRGPTSVITNIASVIYYSVSELNLYCS